MPLNYLKNKTNKQNNPDFLYTAWLALNSQFSISGSSVLGLQAWVIIPGSLRIHKHIYLPRGLKNHASWVKLWHNLQFQVLFFWMILHFFWRGGNLKEKHEGQLRTEPVSCIWDTKSKVFFSDLHEEHWLPTHHITFQDEFKTLCSRPQLTPYFEQIDYP